MNDERLLYRSPHHAANLNNRRFINKWFDITIKVNESEFRAHKVVLAANLKYFDTMLSNDSFRESKQDVIIMKGVKEADLEAFITYAYTGEMLLTPINALDMLITADYLSEDIIKDICIEFLKKHLKAEHACRAYRFASTIGCISLKDEAKRIILSNFEHCSHGIDYLGLEYEHLEDILSNGKAQRVELQKAYLEGIINWLMHNVKTRRTRLEDLFNFVDITKLPDDYLGDYLYRDMTEYSDEYASMRDRIMFYYHFIKNQQCELDITNPTLVIIGITIGNIIFQLCDLTEKKWSPLEKCTGSYNQTIIRGAALDHKFYFTSLESKRLYQDFRVFNFVTKRSKILHTSNSILSCTALCARDRFVYLCGGVMDHNCPVSNQILKYEPEQNSFEALTPMKIQRFDAAATVYRGCLHVLGGWSRSLESLNLVERYDPDTKMWTTLPSMCDVRSGHAVVILGDNLYACGGTDKNSVEVYDPSRNSWQLVASMNSNRAYFCAVVYEGKIWAIGGNKDKTVEVYDPLKNEWQIDYELCAGLEIESPQGSLFYPITED